MTEDVFKKNRNYLANSRICENQLHLFNLCPIF